MDYSETMSVLDSMRSRFKDGFSTIDKNFLDKLHFTLFGKEITNKGCGDCYRDAYILITNHLKKIKTMPQPSLYKLKPGAVIQFFGKSTIYSNANLTDEVAEKFLSQNPAINKRLFSDLPSNWEERVATRIANASAEKESIGNPEVLAKLTEKLSETEKYLEESNARLKISEEKNAELLKENEELKAVKSETPADGNAEKSQEVENLIFELQTLQGENESLKAEIIDLKNKNRALTSANTRLKNNGAVDAHPATENVPE